MSLGIIQRVTERFIQASAPIEVKEVVIPGLGINIEVTGPYDKMKDLIPYLRGKLEYRSRDRAWWVAKEKMTPLKVKNLQKKVDAINGVSGPEPTKVEESEGAIAARVEEAKKLFDQATHMRYPGLSFGVIPSNGLQLKGDLTDLRISINKAGGEYGPEFSAFYPGKLKPVGFKQLLEDVENQGKLIEKVLAGLTGMLPRNFPSLKIDVGLNPGSYLLIVSGKTFDFKDGIKSRVPVTFNGVKTHWWAPLHKIKVSQVKELMEYLEGEEQERVERWKAERAPTKTQDPREEKKRTNSRGDNCHECGGWVNPGEGILFNWYDSEPGDFVWKVKHKDSEDCAKVRAEKKIRSELARTKNEAKRNLMLMCTKSEYHVDGEGHRPPGDQIYIDETALLYGGGTWVVIEPNGDYFWYVKNNGADGDDWSRNNVQTGGAGAIGYRLPMTEEARVLIDVAKS
jgi:hypothetical protein